MTDTVTILRDGELVEIDAAEFEASRAPTPESLWAELRSRRDQLLSASDWTQVADAPVDQAAWAVYRQALRDLPENTEDPANPVWPVPPDAA